MRALEFIVLPYAVSGFGVGFVVGLTGVGGGSLMTPLLVLFFGFHPATAVGTDLLYASVTKTCGTAVHHIGQTVEWRVVGWLGAGSLPASLLTLLLISRQLHSSAVASLISYVLGYALLLSALSLLSLLASLLIGSLPGIALGSVPCVSCSLRYLRLSASVWLHRESAGDGE